MKRFVKHLLMIVPMTLAFGSVHAEQNKCMYGTIKESVGQVITKLRKECAKGDVLFFTYSREYGVDIRTSLAASACDFEKSIVLSGESMACIYNGITKTNSPHEDEPSSEVEQMNRPSKW